MVTIGYVVARRIFRKIITARIAADITTVTFKIRFSFGDGIEVLFKQFAANFCGDRKSLWLIIRNGIRVTVRGLSP